MAFDLELQLRKNPDYRSQVQAQLERIKKAADASEGDPSFFNEYEVEVQRLMELTRYNLVFFTPYAWPKYPKTAPLSYKNYRYALHLFQLRVGGYTLIKGSRQIGKSQSLVCRMMLASRILGGWKSLYITTRADYLKVFANRFREIERAAIWPPHNPNLRNNLEFKEYPNGSSIELTYAHTNADHVRSRSSSDVTIDECQHFDPDLEVEVLQVQSAQDYPITNYTGTSTTTDTFLEHKWVMSSQGIWTMRCENGHWNQPTLEGGVMDMIQESHMGCAKCKIPLNILDGHYDHQDKGALEANRVGIHVPQIIVPARVYNPIKWNEIYNLKLSMGASHKFLEEVLGIATEQGARELTKQQIQAICCLGPKETVQAKARENHYRWIVSGCDWGGSDYNPDLKTKKSTTVHVVAGVCMDHSMEILHFRRYAGMDYDDISDDIVANHKALKGWAMGCDMGVGAVYNSRIRKQIPAERHLMFMYAPPVAELLNEPQKAHPYNMWMLNKTESLSLTINAIREKKIRCFMWEQASEYLLDYLNLFRAPGERTGSGGGGAGSTTFLYRAHPTKTNDALMATNYAYMLCKILSGEAMVSDQSLALRLSSMMTTNDVFANLPESYSY